jgi:hypothetical protein
MIGLIKQAIIFGAVLAVVVGSFILIRTAFYRMGMRTMSKQAYQLASFFFTITGFPFLMENARVYRKYCQFRMGKISYEMIREAIEESQMAYRHDGYSLLKKVNQIENRQRASRAAAQEKAN